ncbi:MAG: hypothetical protein HRT77_00120 [Halioglobus sp.]|nr:hypothetical protein [Halioglobus sp.]
MKFQFLCSNHREWLAKNPQAALNAWRQNYQRSVDLSDDEDFVEAARHAGAAFEAADIILCQGWQPKPTAISQFTDAAVLLVQLLYQLREPRLAANVLGSTLSRLEKMLVGNPDQRRDILAGCARLQCIGDARAPGEQTHPAAEYLLQERSQHVLH